MLISDVDKVADSFNDWCFLRIVIPAFEVASLSSRVLDWIMGLDVECSDKC